MSFKQFSPTAGFQEMGKTGLVWHDWIIVYDIGVLQWKAMTWNAATSLPSINWENNSLITQNITIYIIIYFFYHNNHYFTKWFQYEKKAASRERGQDTLSRAQARPLIHSSFSVSHTLPWFSGQRHFEVILFNSKWS